MIAILRRPGMPGAGSEDPVDALRLVRMRHRALPWHLVPLDELGPRCKEGDGHACSELARGYETLRADFAADLPECVGHDLFARACNDADGGGCVAVAKDLAAGVCGEHDPDRARELLRDECLRHVHEACLVLEDAWTS
jgi:hypothetical protein